MLSIVSEEVLRWYKWFLSFRKATWSYRDYPIRVRLNNQQGLPEDPSAPKYLAQVINWWVMSGAGETPAEAIADLERALEAWRLKHRSMPRPGARVPLEFAPSQRIETLWHVAEHFFPQILGLDLQSVFFVSDESSLTDFSAGPVESLQAKIRQTYGVDVSDIESGNLVEILARIDRKGTAA